MLNLELKIPPPFVLVLCGVVAWAARKVTPTGLVLENPAIHWTAGGMLVGAVVLGTTAIFQFRNARTTVDPTRPENASRLVTNGVFRFTRNPMYLSALLVLGAWAVKLGNAVSLLAVPLFFLYITRFQIEPEERVLRARFGEEYDSYLHRVRRWL